MVGSERDLARSNCSFASGEASAGFATLAIAVLAPVAVRSPAITLALFFGIFVGVLRVAAGGHLRRDVVFAGVLTALVVWLLHGLIYRWPPTRVSESQAEQSVDAVGAARHHGRSARKAVFQ